MLITVFNRDWLLRQSLARLEMLTPPAELIVVDDGSADGTADVVAEFSERLDFPVRYIYTHNPKKSLCSHARNVGVKAAENEWVVTAEPELCFRTDVLAQYAQLQPEHPSDVISAGRIWFAPDGYKPRFDRGGWGVGEKFKPPPRSQEAIGWVAPYTALWNRGWLVEVGGWDESFPGPWGWDDIDLLSRLRTCGHGQHIDQSIECVHLHHGMGGDHNFINEQHFFGKSFNHGHEKHSCSEACLADQPGQARDLVANRGIEWGVPKQR